MDFSDPYNLIHCTVSFLSRVVSVPLDAGERSFPRRKERRKEKRREEKKEYKTRKVKAAEDACE